MSQVWVVRAGDDIEHQKFALDNECAVISFKAMGDMESIDTLDKAKESFREGHPEGRDMSEQKVAAKANQLLLFAHSIEEGDYVILPCKKELPNGNLSSTDYCAVGKVTGSYRYKEEAPVGCKHQRPVDWIDKEFLKDAIPNNSSMSSQLTVFEFHSTNWQDLESALNGR